MPNASEEEIFEFAKLEALATELVCMPYHIVEGEETVYADLSDARSMVKVANGAVIDGEDLPSDFNAKYLSMYSSYVIPTTPNSSRRELLSSASI